VRHIIEEQSSEELNRETDGHVYGALVPTRPDEAKRKGRGRKKERAKRAKWEGVWREEKCFWLYLVADA
jgi:hypothetical protein